MKRDLIYAKKIETKRCLIILHWREKPEFKITKIYLFDKAKIGSDENGKVPDICHTKNKKIKNLENSIIDYFRERKPLKFRLQDFDFGECTEFSKKVLTTLATIPFGKVTTYKKLAELSGFPGAYRALGSVMAKNPFPLLIPCHRVIRSDICLGEFGPGRELKKILLCHEIPEKALEGLDSKLNENYKS